MSVIITTDYKLNQVAGQTYGMCRCNWSAPFDRYDFEKGFVLPNPSKARVAAQALIWALESIRGADFLNPKQDTVIVAQAIPHQTATFAMVLGLLAVIAIGYILPERLRKCH